MAAARVILVSDTHLSASAAQAQANWDAVVSYVDACAPDLVIHLGDLSFDGAHDVADLRHGRTQLGRLPAPWRAVPGNHDIGDNPSPGAPADSNVDAARCQRWATTWAVLPAHVQPVLGAKRCGIVSLTLATGTPAQQELIEPDGLQQLTLTIDLPDPYPS